MACLLQVQLYFVFLFVLRIATLAMFCILTFQPLAVSLRTARFNIQKFYMALA